MSASKRQANNEIIIFLCSDHHSIDLSVTLPNYVFNDLPTFVKNHCEVEGCLNEAYYRFIGIKVPDSCPDLSLKKPILAYDETYLEAVQAMTRGFALDKLTSYLYFRTRTYIHDSGDLSAVLVIKQLARLLLKELQIPENEQMSARQVSRIIKYLRLYPLDQMESNESPAEGA